MPAAGLPFPRKGPQTLINQGFAASGNQKVIKKVIKEKEKESYRIYLRITILKTRCHYKKSSYGTIKNERGLAAPGRLKKPKVLANGQALSESELL